MRVPPQVLLGPRMQVLHLLHADHLLLSDAASMITSDIKVTHRGHCYRVAR